MVTGLKTEFIPLGAKALGAITLPGWVIQIMFDNYKNINHQRNEISC